MTDDRTVFSRAMFSQKSPSQMFRKILSMSVEYMN